MPEYYRVTIGRYYLQQLGAKKSPKEAMHLTREKFKGPSGKRICRDTVYRNVALAKKTIAAEARRKK